MTRPQRRLAALLVVALAIMVSGCQSFLEVAVEVDRDGRGQVDLTLRLDRGAQAALGLGERPDPQAVAERFEPFLVEGGWSGGGVDGPIGARLDDRTGEIVLMARHGVDSVRQLDAILSEARPLAALVPDPASLAALPGLPESGSLLDEFDLTLGEQTGDNPGFDLFARGGVGEIGSDTCQAGEARGFARTLREALALAYRFRLPGGPGETNATDTPGGENIWRARFLDCPALRATSGGGSSSSLVNGVILGGLSGFLLFVLALRSLRRRRRDVPGPGARPPAA